MNRSLWAGKICQIGQRIHALFVKKHWANWCSNYKSGMQAIYIDKILWSPWLLARLVCCQDHLIAALRTSVMYVSICSEWIKAMSTIINAPIVCSKCMPSVITAPLCTKFLIDLAAPCCVCPTLHSPILAIIVLFIIILRQSTSRAPFSKWPWYTWQR